MKTILDVIYYNLMNGYQYGKHVTDVMYPYFDWVLCLGESKGKQYFYWRNFGQSANKANKEELKWLLETIFKLTPYEFVQKYEVYDPKMKTLADIQDMIRMAKDERENGLSISFEIPTEKELNMKVKAYVVWTQFQDDAFAVEIDKAFFNEKDAERYVKEKVDELNYNGYVAYLPDDWQSDDDDNARVWIEEVEVEGRSICGQ